MGKVMVKLTLTNLTDRENAARGTLRHDQVRTLELEALVDTGATMLAIPEDVATRLGLVALRRRSVKLADGTSRQLDHVGGIYLELLGREMTCDALVLPAGATPLVGQMQLEALDLVVDPKSRALTVNPASPDQPMLDLLHVA
jgi:clan AA aspartic protease